MIKFGDKYNRGKAVDLLKFNRRFAVSQMETRTQSAVRQGAAEPVHSAVREDGAPSPNDGPDADGDAERAAGNFSPGKGTDLDPRDAGASSVAKYVSEITGYWRRGTEACLSIACLCAESSERLTPGQKSDLIRSLPFGNTAFSKFVQIASDIRLYAPEIRRLLPPHYTTMYVVTLLTDEELSRAIAENVLRPDTTRARLQKWRNSHRERVVVAPIPKEPASGSAVSLPIAPTAAGSGALPGGDDNRNNQDELAAAPKDAPAPESVAPAAEVAGPLTPPPGDDDIPVFLDRRPLSANDQRAFDGIMAAFNRASAIVRERVRAELARPDAWSGSGTKAVSSRRRDGDASATPNPPTASVVPAYTADAAERAEVKKPEPAGEVPLGAKPEAADPAGAGIKYTDLQVPDYTTGRMRTVVVVRKRRKSRKVPGPLENLPF